MTDRVETASRIAFSLQHRGEDANSSSPGVSASAPLAHLEGEQENGAQGLTDVFFHPHESLWEATEESFDEVVRLIEDLGEFMRDSGMEEWGEDKLSPDAEEIGDALKTFWEGWGATGSPWGGAGLVAGGILMEMALVYGQTVPFLIKWFADQENRRREEERRAKKEKDEEGGGGEEGEDGEGDESGGDGGGSYGGGGGNGGGPDGPEPPPPPPPPPPKDDEDEERNDDRDEDWENERDPLRIRQTVPQLFSETQALGEILDGLGEELSGLKEELMKLGAGPEQMAAWGETLDLIKADREGLEDLLERFRVDPDRPFKALAMGPAAGGGER